MPIIMKMPTSRNTERNVVWIGFIFTAMTIGILQYQLLTIQNSQTNARHIVVNTQLLIVKNQTAIQKDIQDIERSQRIIATYTSPHGSYRMTIDAEVCATLLYSRAIAETLGISQTELSSSATQLTVKRCIVSGP